MSTRGASFALSRRNVVVESNNRKRAPSGSRDSWLWQVGVAVAELGKDLGDVAGNRAESC